MKEMLRFYQEWITTVFRHAFGVADAVGGAIGVIGSALASIFTGDDSVRLNAQLAQLAWLVPLVTFAAVALIRFILAPYWMHRSRVAKFAVPDDLLTPYLSGLTIRLADLARESEIIRGRTFENCELYGPAIIIPQGTTVIQECGIEGDAESALIAVEQPQVLGAIAMVDCVVRRSKLHKIGLMMSPQLAAKVRTEITAAP